MTKKIRRYTATLKHHSIFRARILDAGSTLRGAKRRATQEFGDGFLDHTLVIYDDADYRRAAPIAIRRIGARRWTDHGSA